MSRADFASQCRSCGAPTDAFLCQQDADDIRYALQELPGLLEALADRAGGMSRTYRASSQTRRAPDADWKAVDGAIAASALPGDLDASRLLNEARNTITTCVRDLVESRGAKPPALAHTWVTIRERRLTVRRNRATWVSIDTRVQKPATVQPLDSLVDWLLDSIESIRFDEAAADIRTEIVGLKARLERAVDSVPARFWAGPCKAKTMEGACERDLYTRFNPFAEDAKLDATFTCDGWRGDGRGCGATHKVSDRLGYVLDSVTDALVPLDVLRLVARSRGMPWPVSATIRSWIFRGQLAVRGVSRGGDELFRGGDVIDLVEQWADKVASRSTRSA